MIFKTHETAEVDLVVKNRIDEDILTEEEKEFIRSIEERLMHELEFDCNNDEVYSELTEEESERLRKIIERADDEDAVDWNIDRTITNFWNYDEQGYKNAYLENEDNDF